MPVNGLVAAWDILELKVAGSASGSHSGDGTGVYGWSGNGTTVYAPNQSTVLDGFDIVVGGSSATNQWSVTYTGPGSPSGTTWTGSGWTSAECVIELTDVRLYNIGGAWKLTADYEVFAGGVSRLTGSIDSSSTFFGPSFIPLIGVPLEISGSASASTTGLPTYTETSAYDYNSETTGTVTGGWRFKEVGGVSWQALDVNVLGLSVPTVSCSESTDVSAVSASDTYSLSIPVYSYARTKRTFLETNPLTVDVSAICTPGLGDPYTICGPENGPAECGGTAEYDVYTLENWAESKGGSIMALPDIEKAIKRFNDDFKALVWRAEMPQTVVRRTASCNDGGVVTSDTDDDEVHPYQDEILQVVENAAASMEDTLGYATYAPVTASGSASYTKVHQIYDQCGALLCPPTWFTCDTGGCTGTIAYLCDPVYEEYEDESVSYSASVTFPHMVGTDIAGYLDHSTSKIVRYINSWPNPHWSYALWTESWEVDSSPETWDDYWEKIGSQWIYNSAASITDETRNHLVSEPLGNDGNSGFLETSFGGLRWLGISRWITKEITPRTDYTFDSGSSSLWAGTDCTLTHGSDITVNPSASPCEVELTLGSFTVEPYLWPHLCDRITVDWTATNISDCKVYLEAADGTRVLLNDNEPGSAKYRPSGQSGEYAGSWKQDFGAGVVTDEGSDDISPDGVSATVMASPERAFAFEMLADFTAAKLVFVIEVADVDSDVNIDYPQFEYTKSDTRLLTPENAHQVNIVHEEGAGVRFGFWDTGTSGTVNNPPAIYDPSERPNTIDWLVAERLAVRGVAYNDGLTTELTSLRDTFEGQSVGNERNNSYGFWLMPEPAASDWYLALVSSLAECPPLAIFPRLERDKADWSESGADYVQHVWSWCQGPDYMVSPSQAMHLDHSSTRWTAATTGITGWKRTRHSHMVDNTETGAKIAFDPDEVATVRPWRGFYGVYSLDEVLDSLWNLHVPWSHYHRLAQVSGDIRHSRALAVVPSDGFDSEVDVLTSDEGCIDYDPLGIIVGTFKDGTDGKVYETYDDGEGYSSVATVITGDPVNLHVLVTEHDQPGTRIVTGFIYDSGSSGPGKVFRAVKGPGESSYSTQAAIQDSGGAMSFSDSRHCISEGPDGTLVLVAKLDGETVAKDWYSHDLGETWTES